MKVEYARLDLKQHLIIVSFGDSQGSDPSCMTGKCSRLEILCIRTTALHS